MNHPRAVIVLAAGQGTRMKSSTPKVLHTMCGRPLLGHAIVAAEETEADHIVVVIRHQRERVADMVNSFAPHVILADQDEIPGTGRAVQCGLEQLLESTGKCEGTVLVTSADVPLLESETLKELTRVHEQAGNAVTLVTTIVEDATGYGRIVRADGAVEAIVEHRDASEEQLQIKEINAGIYAFDAQFLRRALAGLDTDNDQGEVYLTDTVAAAVAAGRTCGAYVLTDHWQAQGCNDRAQLAQLRAQMNERILDRHMKAGVSITMPATTSIDVDVQIAPDVTVEPGCVLEGDTVIEPFAIVGPHTTLRNVTVGEGAIVPHCFGYDTTIAAGAIIDPFTELPGSGEDTVSPPPTSGSDAVMEPTSSSATATETN
ncbi:MAG: NTP transferase domain-containing protein [Actinomycetaceae bacterium]|nr:NTP transferase domain-containing protein [Actinomycetaceae bacterium]